jgi:hypothetical protein
VRDRDGGEIGRLGRSRRRVKVAGGGVHEAGVWLSIADPSLLLPAPKRRLIEDVFII